MAAATDELILLERVFLRMGSAETDAELQEAVCKFLPPVLLKLSSSQEGVRKKVMELLIHINRRLRNRPQVQLPVEALLVQYQDPSASSFVINFTIIYIKLGYPRMDIKKQAELVPCILNAIEGKPLSHQDSLLLIIMPVLSHINVPTDPEKRASLLGLQDKHYVAKQLMNFMLDMLLLPYGWAQSPVPPGMSEYALARVTGETPPTAEHLEEMKLGIVNFLSHGIFPDSDILVHLIVAAADTRFRVASLADTVLKKVVLTVDWSSMQLAAPLYTLFLGTDALATQKDVKQEMVRLPASTRIRLKLLHYLCRVNKAGFIIPLCVQVIFDSLYGKNTNTKLKTLALQFTLHIVQQCNLATLTPVAGVLLNGMIKLISEGEDAHKAMAYAIIGQLGQRIPTLINKDFTLLHSLFDTLVSTEGDLRRAVQGVLVTITSAFVLDKNDETNISLMSHLLSSHIESTESIVRFTATHYAAKVLPSDSVLSRYLLLLACGDNKHEVNAEGTRALYGVVRKNEDEKRNEVAQVVMPEFSKMVNYVHSRFRPRVHAAGGKVNVKAKVPYSIETFSEMVTYLRVCLAGSAGIPTEPEPLQHPCEQTPLVGRYLEHLRKTEPETLNNYLEMVMHYGRAAAEQAFLQAILELAGTIPRFTVPAFEKEGPWLSNLLASSKQNVRQLAARIYGIVTAYGSSNEFEARISEISAVVEKKNVIAQHGALLALSYALERRLIAHKNERIELNLDCYRAVVKILCTFTRDSVPLLMDTAVQSIGLLGKTFPLPIPDQGEASPNKRELVETLFSLVKDGKASSKTKGNAALSLGQLCIGERFPYTREIVEKVLDGVKETSDIDLHLTLGEVLVHCVQGEACAEARDSWTTLIEEHKLPYTNESTELLVYVLNYLFNKYQEPHPNSRQAICVWLLALLKYNVDRDCVKERINVFHRVFMDFLADNSDIVQSIAAKGISLIHVNSDKEEREALVSNILNQFAQGRRTVQQVTPDTKLFEEGQLGKTPSSGNLSTYKEICSLATELQKPDLVYYFMNLANHNAVWSSKRGAAFGFAAIADVASEELAKYLPSIIPRLFRYQFDPTPKIQQSMSSIWRALVPSTSKAIEQYHKPILEDITNNLTNNEWRVRISCCNALADLLKANVHINLVEYSPELWRKLFRVMDDIHKATRQAATDTAKILSDVCVKNCSVPGKEAEAIIRAILPVLLDVGAVHTLASVRSISLKTISKLVSSAGILLKPSLVTLIPALLGTIGEVENPQLSYLSTVYDGTTGAQDAIDNLRASVAKAHYATETIPKCIQYIDADILKELMPRITELLRSSVEFGTKIACTHFLDLLSTQAKQELQPHAGKILSALMTGLSDRNAVVRKYNAVTIGHIAGVAKESSLEKLFNTLNTWYMEKEDDATRLAIGQTLQAINNYHQEILRKYSRVVIPLTFFAMHAEKTPENESTVELWTELWNDITPGTESAIRQNLETTAITLRSSLGSSSWNTKIQAAKAIHTVAEKLGPNISPGPRDTLLKVLTDALRGRTWNGKEKLLDALAMLARNSSQAIKENPEMSSAIVEALRRESKKEAVEYRRRAFEAFVTVLRELQMDMFAELYNIAQDILIKALEKDEGEDETAKRQEETMKLIELVFQTLGESLPSSKEAQDKYCLEFLSLCERILPKSTRPVQVSILSTLNVFVDRLVLLKIDSKDMSPEDKKMLASVCEMFNKILNYSIGIFKSIKVKIEVLKIAQNLEKKLRASHNTHELEKLKRVLDEVSAEFSKDKQSGQN